jgi:hypothetical protein
MPGMRWFLLHPNATPDMLGYIPMFLDDRDPRPAREQIMANYVGGWHPFEGFTLNESNGYLEYPEDPPTLPIATVQLRDEVITVYEHSWVLIMQPDKTWEVARLD